jgi:site-specific DNA recombinase
VEILFVKSPKASTPEEELLLQFQGMISEYERAQIVERTRRGKRHKAKSGSINVLSGAPYGYRYMRKTDLSSAYYEVIEEEARVVRKVFKLYTEEVLSINAIARFLNEHHHPTRSKSSRWERSMVWAMLRNPAYVGKACYGKTELVPRRRITRPLRKRGGFSPRVSSNRERPREEWIEIAVPALVDEQTFAQAEELLERNKRFSPRRTIEPTLLQGILVCRECGYAFYRTSTRTSKRNIYYYRCLGSDDYRYPNGRVCQNRPIRQDYLDDLIWKEVMRLLEDPELIRTEIERRIEEIRNSDPVKHKKDGLMKDLTRVQKALERLLDAYQEGLIELDVLRKRTPELRRKQNELRSELERLEIAAASQQTFLRLAENIEDFLARFRERAETMDVMERQKVLRLVVKEILIGDNDIIIRHSIPTTGTDTSPKSQKEEIEAPSYLLRSGSTEPPFSQSTPG